MAACQLTSGQTADAICSLCSSIIKAGQHTLRCADCGISIHLNCMYKAFKDAGNDTPKNKPDWLHEFILHSALAHRCKDCSEKFATAPREQRKADVSKETAAIAVLEAKIQSLHNAITKLIPSEDAITATGDKSVPPRYPLTYAQAAVSTAAVKSAVSEAIQNSKKQPVTSPVSSCLVFPTKETTTNICGKCWTSWTVDALSPIIQGSALPTTGYVPSDLSLNLLMMPNWFWLEPNIYEPTSTTLEYSLTSGCQKQR